MNDADTVAELTPAIRISVEARGRGKHSSYLSHTLAHLLAQAGYNDVRLSSHRQEISSFLTKADVETARNTPIQVVEMLALDKPGAPIYTLMLRRQGPTFKELDERIESLFDAIAHGDEGHRKWLKEAIVAHLQGEPMPIYVDSAKKNVIEVPDPATQMDVAGERASRQIGDKDTFMDGFYEGVKFLAAWNDSKSVKPGNTVVDGPNGINV